MNPTLKKLLIALAALVLLAVLALSLPPLRESIAWRVENVLTRVRFALNPPEKVHFALSSPTAAAVPSLPAPTVTATHTHRR